MEQKLSRYQNVLVLLITLLLHAGIILSIIIIKFEHPPAEAVVLLAQEEQPNPHQTAQNNWVTMMKSTPSPSKQPIYPSSASANMHEPIQEQEQQPTKEKTTSSLDDNQIQHAVSMAQKLLERSQKQAKETEELCKTQQITPKQPQMTLAQLTQGFMQHLQESPITVRSNNSGQVSMEQLQQMHYLQKIIACLVNSYKINSHSRLHGYEMQQARIQLSVNRDGSIHLLQLVQSSGNLTIDQFLLTIFRDASSSFPPFPSSFKDNVLHIPMFNVDRLESFSSTAGWYVDNTMQ